MILKKNPSITLEEIKNSLTKRFFHEAGALKFMEQKRTKTIKEFTQLLETANKAYNWYFTEDEFLVAAVTTRAPNSIKTIGIEDN